MVDGSPAPFTPDELEAALAGTPVRDFAGRARLYPILGARAYFWASRWRSHHHYATVAVDYLPEPALALGTAQEVAQGWPAKEPRDIVRLSLLEVCEAIVQNHYSGAYVDGRHDEQFNIGAREALYIYYGFWPAPIASGDSASELVIPENWKATVRPRTAEWRWVGERAVEVLRGRPEVTAAYHVELSMNGRPPVQAVFLEQPGGAPAGDFAPIAQQVQDAVGKWPVVKGLTRPVIVFSMLPGIRDAVLTTRPFYVSPGVATNNR